MYFEKFEPGQLSRHSDGPWAGRPEFHSWKGQNVSVLHGVNTNSGACQASYGMDTGGKAAGHLKLTAHLRLVPRSRMVELYLRYPVCIHGIFFPLALQSSSGLGRLHEILHFTSVTRSRTVGRTPWTGVQLVARPLPVHKHSKMHTQHKH
jgi:hypothetical protein